MFENLVFAAALVSSPTQLHTDMSTQRFMSCVSHRESRGKPTAVSSTGAHRGKFQVTDAMRAGMSWMVTPWLKTWTPDASRYAAKLRVTPMNRWPERVQDAAFVATLHYDGVRWSGWKHWYLPGSSCNRLVP